jgi:hypothetical protein
LVEEIWVNVTEGAEKTGYNRQYVMKLVGKIWRQPEETRPIRLRKRTNGYDIWLPDLMVYIEQSRHGPYGKRTDDE